MWQKAVNLLYPEDPPPQICRRVIAPYCDICGEPVQGQISDHFVCSNCDGRRWYIRKARAAYLAEADVLEWIHHCKYRSDWHRIPQLGKWLVEGYETFYRTETIDCIIPVPLHWQRFWERGFNQARELSRYLSRHSGLPLKEVLHRTKNTQVQASLNRKQRLHNCRHAFSMKKRTFDVKGKRLLLIDDVFTTGSTVNACARQLKQSGALDVSVLTVARGGNF